MIRNKINKLISTNKINVHSQKQSSIAFEVAHSLSLEFEARIALKIANFQQFRQTLKVIKIPEPLLKKV
jgi:hypothetical protein